MFRTITGGALALLVVVTLAATALAATTTVTVTADGEGGWSLNGDPNNVTPYDFTSAEASLEDGSLRISPITNTINGNADKFTAGLVIGMPVADLASVSYDFLIAGGTSAAANQFYLNVYTQYATPLNWYDCRFDYVPATGSTSNFTTKSIGSADLATAVANKSGGCPATLAGMPAGSTVLFIVLNVGDTSASDTGIGGYFDNVVLVTTSGDTTIYDFEAFEQEDHDNDDRDDDDDDDDDRDDDDDDDRDDDDDDDDEREDDDD